MYFTCLQEAFPVTLISKLVLLVACTACGERRVAYSQSVVSCISCVNAITYNQSCFYIFPYLPFPALLVLIASLIIQAPQAGEAVEFLIEEGKPVEFRQEVVTLAPFFGGHIIGDAKYS